MRYLTLALLLIGCLQVPRAAQADTILNLEQGKQRVYLGTGRTLEASEPNQLTFHAHIGQFLFRPSAAQIAFTTSEASGVHFAEAVKLIGTDGKPAATLLSHDTTLDANFQQCTFVLEGWSGDGRYLLVSHFERLAGKDASPDSTLTVYESIDVGVSPPVVRRVPLPRQSTEIGSSTGSMSLSPSGKVFAIGYAAPQYGGLVTGVAVFLYGPAQDTLRRIPLPDGTEFSDWKDDTHLALTRQTQTGASSISRDIVTGKETPADGTARVPISPPGRFPEAELSFGPGGAFLPLSPGHAHASVYTLSLGVTPKNRERMYLCLGVTLGMFLPAFAMASDQSSAAWVEHGDLYLSAFSVGAATKDEISQDGDLLSCAEQQALAEERVRKIGSDLLYQAQYGDGFLPTTAHFHDFIFGQRGDESALAVAGHAFAYAVPDGLKWKSIAKPGAFVLGKLVLPCVTVTLYADGHVKSIAH